MKGKYKKGFYIEYYRIGSKRRNTSIIYETSEKAEEAALFYRDHPDAWDRINVKKYEK